MGSIIYKTGNRINKYFSVIFLLWIMNSCNIDVRDCRLTVVNKMQRDVYIDVTTLNDSYKKQEFIKAFNVNLLGNREYPTQVEISSTKINDRGVHCLNPGETEHAKMFYVYIFNIDSLITNYDQKTDIERIDDYHILCYSIEELDSLKWEISIDSLAFRNKMCR